MTAYLLTWNPRRWDWHYLQQSIQIVRRDGYCLERWSCGVTKKIEIGDRVFLMRLGEEPRGIMASGFVTQRPAETEHWDAEKRARGQLALFIEAEFEALLDPERAIFSIARLAEPAYCAMHWTPQGSGVTIPGLVAAELEKDWRTFLASVN